LDEEIEENWVPDYNIFTDVEFMGDIAKRAVMEEFLSKDEIKKYIYELIFYSI